MEEINGLNWRIQELSEMEQELTQLQAEMFEVSSVRLFGYFRGNSD